MESQSLLAGTSSRRPRDHVDRVRAQSPTPISTAIEVLKSHGCAPRRTPRGWQSRCPAHSDATPSLTIAEGRGGRVLLHCWAGCSVRAVLTALGLGWADLFATPRRVRR